MSDLVKLLRGTRPIDMPLAILLDAADRIQELEDGSCRFHCRTVKQAFIAGYLADSQHGEHSDEAAELAYKEWKD